MSGNRSSFETSLARYPADKEMSLIVSTIKCTIFSLSIAVVPTSSLGRLDLAAAAHLG